MVSIEDVQVENEREAILLLRFKLELCQWEFAEIIGVNPNYLSGIENGRIPINKKLIGKINKYLAERALERGEEQGEDLHRTEQQGSV